MNRIQSATIGTRIADPETKKPATPRGTPHAKSWDKQWITHVEAREDELDRPICGARTPAGTPCGLAPNHQNGRCRFHGGFDLTGAPAGNRNAVIHGLYTRNLRLCTDTCPLWNTCPCSGKDLQDIDPKETPTCPYERTEYNTLMTGLLQKVERRDDPSLLHLAHLVALFHTMLSRAASALNQVPLTHEDHAKGKNYTATTTKASPHLEAYLRIAREYRRYRKLFDEALKEANEHRYDPATPVGEYYLDRAQHRAQTDTDLSPDAGHPTDGQATILDSETPRQTVSIQYLHEALKKYSQHPLEYRLRNLQRLNPQHHLPNQLTPHYQTLLQNNPQPPPT